MAVVEVYTTAYCPYCVRAKRLLSERGIPYREVDVATDDVRREEMIRRSGRRSVPQIFIDGQAIGGFDELAAIDASGELRTLTGTP
jgi:glutaredoxin 3